MASRSLALPFGAGRRPVRTSPRLVIAALAVSALVGAITAYNVKVGVAVVVGLCLLAVAMLNLPMAVCAWLVVEWFGRVPALEQVPNRVLSVVGICWLAMVLDRRTATGTEGLRSKPARAAVMAAVTFVVWQIFSLAWAPDFGVGFPQFKILLYCLLAFVLVLGTIVEPRHVRWVLQAFVIGAVLTVLMGAGEGSLTTGAELTTAAAVAAERFHGGAGDPNYLAAVLVPGIIFAIALALRASATERLALVVAVMVMGVGLAATRSRGGLIAMGVAVGLSLALWRGRRMLLATALVFFLGALTAFFASSPAAWERIVNGDNGGGSGSGRLDIWQVAWRITEAHPIFGVGLNQFTVVSPHYVNLPGVLGFVGLIVDKHIVVHNMYLQLWAETGIIGLLLLVALIVVSFTWAWRAIIRFDAMGNDEMASFARAVIPALAGVLTATFFLSDISDRRIWFLLALGPLLAGIAERQARKLPARGRQPNAGSVLPVAYGSEQLPHALR